MGGMSVCGGVVLRPCLCVCVTWLRPLFTSVAHVDAHGAGNVADGVFILLSDVQENGLHAGLCTVLHVCKLARRHLCE